MPPKNKPIINARKNKKASGPLFLINPGSVLKPAVRQGSATELINSARNVFKKSPFDLKLAKEQSKRGESTRKVQLLNERASAFHFLLMAIRNAGFAEREQVALVRLGIGTK